MTKKAKVADDLEATLGTVAPDVNQLKAVEQLVNTGAQLVERINKGEALLKSLKAELHELTNTTLPDLLAAAGTSIFRIDSGPYQGWKVESKPFVAGSLPKEDDRRAVALQWIRDQKAGDIIKNKLAVEFERGEDNIAGEIKAKLEELGMDFELKEDVHAQTLLAFARERMKNGEDVPLSTLGLYAGRQAKIEPPKKGRG